MPHFSAKSGSKKRRSHTVKHFKCKHLVNAQLRRFRFSTGSFTMLRNRKGCATSNWAKQEFSQAAVEGKAVLSTARKTDRNQERLPRTPVTHAGLWCARIA